MSNLALAEDVGLISELVAGNEIAFRRLFEKYHQQLGKYIFRITDSLELTEEIVQDVFLKIWLNRESLCGVSNFGGYLYIASKNHALNHLKKQINLRRHQAKLEVEYVHSMDHDEDLADCYQLIDEAIDQLPTQQRAVYLMSRHERLKYAEIAEKMDLSKETVKKYIQIASSSITVYVQKNREASLLVFFVISFL